VENGVNLVAVLCTYVIVTLCITHSPLYVVTLTY